MKIQNKFDNSLVYKTSIIGLALFIAIYAICIISKPLISPEIGIAFSMIDQIKNFDQVLDKFLTFNEDWYRPFTFYLTNFFIFQLIDIHNIYLIKVISLIIILLNGFIATELAKKIFNSNPIERIIIFTLIVSHPLYYSIAYEGSGLSDPIFNLFINLAVICFLSLLKNKENKVSSKCEGATLSFLCCLFILLTILSQERGLAVFLMIGFLYLFYHYKDIKNQNFIPNLSILSVALFSAILFIIYLSLVYESKNDWTGEHYRTRFEIQYFIANLIKIPELPFRLMFHRTGKVYDAHLNNVFNIFAAPFIIASIVYVKDLLRDKEEINRLIVLLILFISSLPIPVIFGGNSWHFYTASIYISILMGRSFYYCLVKYCNNQYLHSIFIALFFIWICVSSVRGVSEELPRQGNFIKFMSMIDVAKNSRALNDIDYKPEVVYYDTGVWNDFTWPFGGQGNLFKYLYKDRNIIEIALNNGKVIESNMHLCRDLTGKEKTLSFAFNVEKMSWGKIKNINYCKNK